MAEYKHIAFISVLVGGETGQEQKGDISGSFFDVDELQEILAKYGWHQIMERLTYLQWQVWQAVRSKPDFMEQMVRRENIPLKELEGTPVIDKSWMIPEAGTIPGDLPELKTAVIDRSKLTEQDRQILDSFSSLHTVYGPPAETEEEKISKLEIAKKLLSTLPKGQVKMGKSGKLEFIKENPAEEIDVTLPSAPDISILPDVEEEKYIDPLEQAKPKEEAKKYPFEK